MPGGGGGGGGYDSTSGAFQMRSMQLSQQQRSAAVTNIMLAAEQIRVDCVQLTTNGRYVVTGSIYGPPQVWDLKVIYLSHPPTALSPSRELTFHNRRNHP